MSISASPVFSMGQTVFPKAILDTYLDVTTPMKPILMFDLNKMAYKVTQINVQVNSTGQSIYYTVTLANVSTTNPTGISESNTMSNILESNLYSLSTAKGLISTNSNSKINDFETYLASLT